MATLLELAMAAPRVRRRSAQSSEESIELALAWLADKVAQKQAATALGFKSGNQGSFYNWVAMTLREAYRQRVLVIKEPK